MISPGIRPPAFVVSDTNHGGLALIVTLLLMAWSLMCYLIRVYTRVSNRTTIFGVDDITCLFSTVGASEPG
jgi:hypothetical protein